jgi:hypothetical protein
MNRALVAKSLRLILVAAFVAAVFPLVRVLGSSAVVGQSEFALLLPFLAAAVAAAVLPVVLTEADRLLKPIAAGATTTPYSALAEAAARIRAGSLEQSLPGLARVLAEGTGARRAELWLAVEDRLMSAASYPPSAVSAPREVANLAVLLAQPDVDHVVPVLEGITLRAVLAISKPGRPITPADLRLMQDVANGAGLLLRGVALNAELAERVRRADELAAELRASRQRLTQARDVERRRLISELGNATSDRLADLRADLARATHALDPSSPGPGDQQAGGARTDDPGDDDLDDDLDEDGADDGERSARSGTKAAQRAVARARTRLDELLDRFRVIARGVYPAVLRDQGPYGALDELVTDLPRPVRLTGDLPNRLAWEVESGIYYLAASAVRQLADRGGDQPLRVHLANDAGRLSVQIEDPAPDTTLPELRQALAHDMERLAALGGMMDVFSNPDGGLCLRAWLPDQLEPSVDLTVMAAGSNQLSQLAAVSARTATAPGRTATGPGRA